MFLRGFILLALNVAVSTSLDNSSCNILDYCGYDGTCSGFDSFSSLNAMPCNDSMTNLFPDYKGYYYITYRPKHPLILNNQLELNRMIDIIISPRLYTIGCIYFYDIAGFDINFMSNFSPVELYEYVFYELRFDFYLNGNKIDPACDHVNWFKIYKNSTNLLSMFSLSLKFKNTDFPPRICPSMFHSFKCDDLVIYGRIFRFDTGQYPFLSEIKSNVKSLIIKYIYMLELTNQTLHPAVFSDLERLHIEIVSVHQIDKEIFKTFGALQYIFLSFINMRCFYHFNQIDWLTHLNNKPLNEIHFKKTDIESINYVSMNYVLLKLRSHANNDDLYPVEFFPYLEYKYPDEDLCLFAPFPHKNLIFPLLIANLTDSNCSCTLRWILKHVPYYTSIGILNNYSDFTLNEICFNKSTDDCELRLNYCNRSVLSSYEASYFSIYELKNIMSNIQHYSLDIFGPITSSISLVTNLLTLFTVWKIKVINKKKIKCLKSDHLLYDYMFWNAMLNLLYSTFYLFYYSFKCDLKSKSNRGYVTDTCFQEQTYASIVGSVIKLMSNFFFLQMCLNRFVLVGKDHNEMLVHISQVRPKMFLLATGLISSLLSVIVYFQQQFFGSQTTSPGWVWFEDYYYHNYYWYWTNEKDKHAYMKLVMSKLSQLPVLSTFMFIHDFFSYFFFCICCLVIDALTVRNLKQTLAEKTKICSIDRDQEARKSEIKSIIMVVLSTIFNFILRSPELFSIVFFYVLLFNKESHYIFKMLCYSYRECLPIVEITNVFYLSSLSLNFVFYLSFNCVFRDAFVRFVMKR